MTGIARIARWTAGALAGLSVRDLAGALATVLILVLATCWVLRDEDRSRRLTLIIGAWRGTHPRPDGQLVREAPGQRNSRAVAAGSGPSTRPGGRARSTE